MQACLGAAFARGGEPEKARVILNQPNNSKEYASPVELSVLYNALGERELAFALLEKSYTERDLQLQFLGVETTFDELRCDSRFQDLLRLVGLSQ